jgi:hypothetical protein
VLRVPGGSGSRSGRSSGRQCIQHTLQRRQANSERGGTNRKGLPSREEGSATLQGVRGWMVCVLVRGRICSLPEEERTYGIDRWQIERRHQLDQQVLLTCAHAGKKVYKHKQALQSAQNSILMAHTAYTPGAVCICV